MTSKLALIFLLLLGYAGWVAWMAVIFASEHNGFRTFLNFDTFGEGFAEATIFSFLAGIFAFIAGWKVRDLWK